MGSHARAPKVGTLNYGACPFGTILKPFLDRVRTSLIPFLDEFWGPGGSRGVWEGNLGPCWPPDSIFVFFHRFCFDFWGAPCGPSLSPALLWSTSGFLAMFAAKEREVLDSVAGGRDGPRGRDFWTPSALQVGSQVEAQKFTLCSKIVLTALWREGLRRRF